MEGGVMFNEQAKKFFFISYNFGGECKKLYLCLYIFLKRGNISIEVPKPK